MHFKSLFSHLKIKEKRTLDLFFYFRKVLYLKENKQRFSNTFVCCPHLESNSEPPHTMSAALATGLAATPSIVNRAPIVD